MSTETTSSSTSGGDPPNAECSVTLELGEVTRLTLNRPNQANALDWDTGERFERAVQAICDDPTVRVVVVAGAGKHFCAGGDFGFIEQNTALPMAKVEQRMLRFYGMFLSVLQIPVPTVAVVQGSAIGAGLCLALCCDLRIGASEARLGVNFVRLGLHPGMAATALVPHRVGARAEELLLSGRLVNGDEAAQLGLLTRAVARADLEAAVAASLRDLLAGGPAALKQTIESLRGPLRRQVQDAVQREARCQSIDFAGREVALVVEAFHRKQVPQF